jgi:hypothetical protein
MSDEMSEKIYYVYLIGKGFVPVRRARPVNIVDYADTIIHVPIDHEGWSVSEVKTGCKISGGSTEEEAIESAKTRFAMYGEEAFRAGVAKRIKEYGYTPGHEPKTDASDA